MKATLFTAMFFAFFALTTLVVSILSFCDGDVFGGIMGLLVCAIDIFDSIVCFLSWREDRSDTE